MAKLLGWKDVLRPIRDGYRHLFPAPDTGPTPEERRKQRELDRLKGFTYFDIFDQLEQWTEKDSDPLQRANIPLLRRPVLVQNDEAKADITLIHDYAGNYHPYEAIQRINTDAESYTCEYLQHVDTFIYFSHKLVCVPPPTWTNVLHRNGVMSLGTFLIEPQTEHSEKMFERTGDHNKWKFPVAKKLADIAKHYGFDGWLINIEKPFPRDEWNPDVMDIFLEDLRLEMGRDKKLVWYDALTFYNKVSYQNTLNKNNAPFAIPSGDILLNYCWSETDAKAAVDFAPRINLPLRNATFGIDVWAQNTTKLAHPRVTYPEKGGGGTNTGVAVAKLADLGLSAGIFAPAWSFEHFPDQGRAVERAVWEGTDLTEGLNCSCGNCKTRHQVNPQFPIIKSSREHAAGSDNFFYTDFCRAFRKYAEQEKEIIYAQISDQSVLPRSLTLAHDHNAVHLSYEIADTTEGAQLIVEQICPTSTSKDLEQRLLLYKLDMSMTRPLAFQAMCRNLASSNPDLSIGFYLKFSSGDIQFVPISRNNDHQLVKSPIDIRTQATSSVRLQEFGVHVLGPATKAQRLLEISDICIMPESALHDSQHTIYNTRAEHRGEGENSHLRLCWDCSFGDNFEKIEGLPWSEITGPFSYFKIFVNGLDSGRAYAFEHPLPQDLAEGVKERSIEIVGVGFDGRQLAKSKVVLSM